MITSDIATLHPFCLLTTQRIGSLRTVDDVRDGTRRGYGQTLWQRLLDQIEQDGATAPLTPATPHPRRAAGDIALQNREFTIVGLVADRIVNGALAALLMGERRYADTVFRQVQSLYDETQWPELEDQAHLDAGDYCSLRRGQLAFALGLAYDWIHPLLNDAERVDYRAGFDRRFTQAFRNGLERGDCFTRFNNNFVSTIYGGFAVAAIGFGEDYAESAWLREICFPRMDAYVASLFGPEGEFPESVGYAGSVGAVVYYLLARHYDRTVRAEPEKSAPFTTGGFERFCLWYLHCTLPPGRTIAFGDGPVDARPAANLFAAVAAARRDGTAQWFYGQYAELHSPDSRKWALELLAYDPTVPVQSPDGRLPLGRAFPTYAKIVVSRADWCPLGSPSILYAKADREPNHSHADWGQVCLDGFGQRLLVDLGWSPGYPIHVNRKHIYNYQQAGHNVLMIGDAASGGSQHGTGGGTLLNATFDPARGGTWQFDLTPVYARARRVRRSVVHLLPRIAVVVDEADVRESETEIGLRWHLGAEPEWDVGGNFTCRVPPATLCGWTGRIDGPSDLTLARHVYREPYHVDRLGNVFVQQHEPYLELTATTGAWRSLGIFAVFGTDETPADWERSANAWRIVTPEGPVEIRLDKDRLEARNHSTGLGWTVDIN